MEEKISVSVFLPKRRMPAILQHLHLIADTPPGKRLHNTFKRMRIVLTMDHIHRTNDLF